MTWYPVRTRAGAFRQLQSKAITKIEQALAYHDLHGYIPLEYQEVVHWRTKKKILLRRPLLQGWIFLMDPKDWRYIEESVPEIMGPIRSMDNRPIAIASSEVERIMEAEAAIKEAFEQARRDREMTKTRVSAMYPSGSTATITGDHVFSGQKVRVKAATGRKTVKVMLELLGGLVEAEVPITNLEAAQ